MADDIYNRFSASKNYDQHLFRASKGLQSAELNEIQAGFQHHLKGFGDVLFSEGDILAGVEPILVGSVLSIYDSVVYLLGSARQVAAKDVTIPVEGEVFVGVYVKQTVITALEDPELRDPAVGTRNYQEEGSHRLQITCEWGWEGDDQISGEFYPVYKIVDGNLFQNTPPPQLNSTLQLVARYDATANGSYIVNGLSPQFISVQTIEDKEKLVYSVREGEAHVNGFEVKKVNSTKVMAEYNPPSSEILSEPHAFQSGGAGNVWIPLNRTPVNNVRTIQITKRTTEDITHGAFTGAIDRLPDQAILSIVSVKQGETEYAQGVDFNRAGDNLDWSLAGEEPAPSSTYTVVYDHVVLIDPLAVTATHIHVDTALDGTIIYVDYEWNMPRIDSLALSQEGDLIVVEGQPSKYSPAVAKVPSNLLGLAEIHHDWVNDPRIVLNGVKVIPMRDIEEMQQDINNLYDLVAAERLRNDANAVDPSAKKGLFVDPFLDDGLRDQGVAQTGAIFGGTLNLPIQATADDVSQNMKQVETLDYEPEIILSQNKATGSMKINPYQSFDPLPAKVDLVVAVDRFTEVNSQWASPITQRVNQIVRGQWWLNGRVLSSSTSTQTRTVSTQQAEFLRSIPVRIIASGFDANENIVTILFDGIDVTP